MPYRIHRIETEDRRCALLRYVPAARLIERRYMWTVVGKRRPAQRGLRLSCRKQAEKGNPGIIHQFSDDDAHTLGLRNSPLIQRRSSPPHESEGHGRRHTQHCRDCGIQCPSIYDEVLILVIPLQRRLFGTSGPAALSTPTALAMRPDGPLYVLDKGHSRIVSFGTTDGDYYVSEVAIYRERERRRRHLRHLYRDCRRELARREGG